MQEFGEELDKDGCATVGMDAHTAAHLDPIAMPHTQAQGPQLHHAGPPVDGHQVELMKQADRLMFGMMGSAIPPAASHLAAMQATTAMPQPGSPFAMTRAVGRPGVMIADAQTPRHSAHELSAVYRDVTPSKPVSTSNLEKRWSAMRQAEQDIAERSVRSPVARSDQTKARSHFADCIMRQDKASGKNTADYLECSELVSVPVIPSLQVDGLAIRESQCSEHSRSSAASGADTAQSGGSDPHVGDAGIAVVLEVSSEEGGCLRVSDVEADSTAETSGQVRRGDFVLMIDGVSLTGTEANANTFKLLSEGPVGSYASFRLMDPKTRQVRTTELLRAMKASQSHRFLRRHRRLVRALSGDSREGKERLEHNLQIFDGPEIAVPNIVVLGTKNSGKTTLLRTLYSRLNGGSARLPSSFRHLTAGRGSMSWRLNKMRAAARPELGDQQPCTLTDTISLDAFGETAEACTPFLRWILTGKLHTGVTTAVRRSVLCVWRAGIAGCTLTQLRPVPKI